MAYGSNLSRERFLAYLTGGPGPGGSGHHRGARDPSPPVADRPTRVDRRLLFIGESKRWGGGVCAVVRQRDGADPVECLGRAWLITADQLLDVWRQENGGLETSGISWRELDQLGHVDSASGRYRRLDRLPDIDGIPAATITCGPEMTNRPTEPTPSYLDMVASGLVEAWALTSDDAAAYLMRHVGDVTGPQPDDIPTS